MTLLEAVKANPTLVNVPENTILAAFISRGVDYTEDYTTSQKEPVELVSADLYVAIAGAPNFSEGDLSITHNPITLMNRARNIYTKYDDDAAVEIARTPLDLKISRE